jgi:hypothetical protein
MNRLSEEEFSMREYGFEERTPGKILEDKAKTIGKPQRQE